MIPKLKRTPLAHIMRISMKHSNIEAASTSGFHEQANRPFAIFRIFKYKIVQELDLTRFSLIDA
jgi:hypothetical protein